MSMFWYIESLWALLWTGGVACEMPFDQPVPSNMAEMCPKLMTDDGSKFEKNMHLRPNNDLFRMLDSALPTQLVDCRRLSLGLQRKRTSATKSPPRAVEPLEWALDPDCNWDEVKLTLAA